MSISGNMVGMYSTLGKTFIFADSEGNELTGVITEQFTILDVTDQDVKKGIVYAGDEGISIGTMEMPAYTYAIVNDAGLCDEVRGTSKNYDGVDGYVAVSSYNPNYIDKYYNENDGRWYLEASFVTKLTLE